MTLVGLKWNISNRTHTNTHTVEVDMWKIVSMWVCVYPINKQSNTWTLFSSLITKPLSSTVHINYTMNNCSTTSCNITTHLVIPVLEIIGWWSRFQRFRKFVPCLDNSIAEEVLPQAQVRFLWYHSQSSCCSAVALDDGVASCWPLCLIGKVEPRCGINIIDSVYNFVRLNKIPPQSPINKCRQIYLFQFFFVGSFQTLNTTHSSPLNTFDQFYILL